MRSKPGKQAALDASLADLQALADPERAANYAWFFKTGPGEYGEGDLVLGLTMPEIHALARRYRGLSLEDAEELLQPTWHEESMVALRGARALSGPKDSGSGVQGDA